MRQPESENDSAPTGSSRSEASRPGDARDSRLNPTIVYGLLSGLLLWAAFPPIGLWPLAWLAPIPWCLLIARRELAGRRPVRSLYLAGLVHWLLVIHWIRLPHWSAYFGWVVLAGYLAVYVPVFVMLTRQLVHLWRWPLVVAAPLIWTGLELIRAYFLTGFSMAQLGHTQVAWLPVIQIADLGGAYAVSFVVMLVAAGIAQSIPGLLESRGSGGSRSGDLSNPSGASWWVPATVAAGALGTTLFYGHWRLDQLAAAENENDKASISVALIQGSRDTTFSAADDPRDTLAQYRQLTRQACTQQPDVDLSLIHI